MVTKARHPADEANLMEAVATVLSTGDALGYTPDELVDALRLPIDGAELQHDLEELVDLGMLDRRGVGRGALYTLLAPVRLADEPISAGLGAAAGGMRHSKAG